MDGILLAWYAWLSSLTQGPAQTAYDLADRVHLPVVSAVLFGLIGATSPCQLTTNLSALAYAAARPAAVRPFRLTLAYVAGKTSVYLVVGAAVVLAGLQLQALSIPVVVVARKALGPLMILIGLGLAGLWRPRLAMSQHLVLTLRGRLPAGGLLGAYGLGLAFSFAFCPTLFLLFFGLTMPLAMGSPGGWAFPGLFALGSSLPLLAVAAVLGAGTGAAEHLARWRTRWQQPLRLIASVVLVLAGVHDTVVYWVL